MNILMVGNFETSWDGSICDEEHIAQSLEGLGHTVYRYPRTADDDGGIWSKTYDFTLIAQWDGYSDSFLDSLPRPLVYWAFDHQDRDQPWHQQLVEAADLYLSKRMEDSVFENWRWLPQDFSPPFLNSYQELTGLDLRKDIDVLFTGSYLDWATERNETLKAIDERYNLTIHSFTPDAWKAQGFSNVYGPVMDQDLPALIDRAKINISIDHTIEAGYWSDRNAQIMACGGFVLFRHVPFSEIVFRDEVEYFYDTEDCLKQIDYYLTNTTVREMVSDSAHAYAQDYLMVDNRVKDLLTLVRGLK